MMGGMVSLVASLLRIPGLDRLGLAEVFTDHSQTLSRLDKNDARHPRVADYVVMYGVPLLVAVASAVAGVRLTAMGPVLSGVAILGSGLFAFLALLFGIQTLGAASQGMTPAVRTLVRETRANVSYAIVVSLGLALFVMLADAVRPIPDPGSSPTPFGLFVSALAIGWLTHLTFVLLMVLNRVRIAVGRVS